MNNFCKYIFFFILLSVIGIACNTKNEISYKENERCIIKKNKVKQRDAFFYINNSNNLDSNTTPIETIIYDSDGFVIEEKYFEQGTIPNKYNRHIKYFKGSRIEFHYLGSEPHFHFFIKYDSANKRIIIIHKVNYISDYDWDKNNETTITECGLNLIPLREIIINKGDTVVKKYKQIIDSCGYKTFLIVNEKTKEKVEIEKYNNSNKRTYWYSYLDSSYKIFNYDKEGMLYERKFYENGGLLYNTYKYDKDRNLIESKDFYNNILRNYSKYKYGENRNRLEEILYYPKDSFLNYKQTYEYDKDLRLIRTEFTDKSGESYTYYPNGLLNEKSSYQAGKKQYYYKYKYIYYK